MNRRTYHSPTTSAGRTLPVPSVYTVFWSVVTILVALCALYIYFICASVINVVLREDMLVKVGEADSRISELETAYLERKNMIDESYAQSLGFVALKDKAYVPQYGADGKSLTVNQ